MSEKPITEFVEMDEKTIKKKVDEILRKKQDLFSVENKDPSMSYYWVSTEKKRFEQRKGEGFVPVGSDGSDKNVKTLATKETSRHIMGDTVLMKRPKAITEEINRRRAEEREKLRTKAQEQVREEIEKLAGKRHIRFERGKDDSD